MSAQFSGGVLYLPLDSEIGDLPYGWPLHMHRYAGADQQIVGRDVVETEAHSLKDDDGVYTVTSPGHRLQDVIRLRIGHLHSDAAVVDVVRQISRIGHHSLLALHGLGTRHVTGALLLAALWWLQRRGWVRRAAAFVSRPSGATEGGAS